MKKHLTLKVRAFLSVAIALTLLSSGISAAHAVATAPSDVTVTNASVSGALVTDGWASVKWSATPGSVSYVVEATATGETTITSSPIPFVFGQVNYEYVVEGLSGGVSYGFTVKAVDISNNQATSAATNFLVQSVPDKATAISAVAAPGQITLTWTPPTNTGGLNLGSYSITSVSPAVSTTADSTATEKVITGLTPGASYVFTLVATNSLGNSEGTVFASATVPNVPDAPAKPSATTTGTSIKVDWTDPASNGGSSLTGYKVYLVNTTTSVDAYSKTDLSSSTNTWTFDSVASGSYTAQVVAVNLVNDSARSVASDIQVVAAPVALPSITLSAASETATVGTAITGFTVDSSAGGAVESYAISPDAPAGLTFNTTSGALSGTPTTAQSATTYTVTATNTSGNATDTFELTIAAATQTITFNTLANKTYGDAAFTVSATSTSSLTVAFSSATSGVCSVASTTVTILSAGTCTQRANMARALARRETAGTASGNSLRMYVLESFGSHRKRKNQLPERD